MDNRKADFLCAAVSLIVVLGLLAAVGDLQADVGGDANVPFIDVMPPPIAVTPDSDEPDPIRALRAATFEEEVLELTNIERWNNGQLPPLKGEVLLDSSSETHSTNMAVRDFFGHCDLDTGTLPGDRMTAAGYFWNAAAENIAAGYSSATAVVAGWMGSTGHRANILSTNYRELGIGYYYQAGDAATVRQDMDTNCVAESTGGPYLRYWTQNFGRRNSVYPVVINREAYETDSVDVDLYLYGEGWATQMRIRNENGAFGAWQTFSSNVSWQLSDGPGTKQVYVEITNGPTTYAVSDTILSTAAGTGSIFADGFESGNTLNWSSAVP